MLPEALTLGLAAAAVAAHARKLAATRLYRPVDGGGYIPPRGRAAKLAAALLACPSCACWWASLLLAGLLLAGDVGRAVLIVLAANAAGASALGQISRWFAPPPTQPPSSRGQVGASRRPAPCPCTDDLPPKA
jgi:hypothetical protein